MNAADRHRLHAAEQLLCTVVEHYYTGCQAYHAAARPDSNQRVFWRITLGTLAEFGTQLADALEVAVPDWDAIRDLAEAAPPTAAVANLNPPVNPITAHRTRQEARHTGGLPTHPTPQEVTR